MAIDCVSWALVTMMESKSVVSIGLWLVKSFKAF